VLQLDVLIDENENAKIRDFGQSRFLVEEGKMTAPAPHWGNIRHLAPELLKDYNAPAVTMASDIYSLGCVGLYVC
jgi:serine/threonine protein kinase